MARRGRLRASSLVGVILIFVTLCMLGWPGNPITSGISGIVGVSSIYYFLGWQSLYFLLGVGMALLADVWTEKSLYLALFLIFAVIVIFCNLNQYYLWSPLWSSIWQRIAGLFSLLLGFFFILCARYYTVKVTVRNHSSRY